MIPRIGPVELLLILVIVTMLFGVGKLPEVFGAVGRGIREFRRGASDIEDIANLEEGVTETTTAEAPAQPSADVQVDTQTETTTTTDGVQPRSDA